MTPKSRLRVASFTAFFLCTSHPEPQRFSLPHLFGGDPPDGDPSAVNDETKNKRGFHRHADAHDITHRRSKQAMAGTMLDSGRMNEKINHVLSNFMSGRPCDRVLDLLDGRDGGQRACRAGLCPGPMGHVASLCLPTAYAGTSR